MSDLGKSLIFFALLVAAAGLPATGCGVRQYNAKTPPVEERSMAAYGPFYSAGQGSGSMSAPQCCKTPPCNHPCVRMKASVGLPYQFDINPNIKQGVAVGTTFPNTDPSGFYNYTGTAGAGKTKVSSGARFPQFPRLENRDLKIIKRAAK